MIRLFEGNNGVDIFTSYGARQLDLAAVTPRLFGEPRRYASELLAIRQGPISLNMATHSLFALVDNHRISLP
jgi:hypothetical protein